MLCQIWGFRTVDCGSGHISALAGTSCRVQCIGGGDPADGFGQLKCTALGSWSLQPASDYGCLG